MGDVCVDAVVRMLCRKEGCRIDVSIFDELWVEVRRRNCKARWHDGLVRTLDGVVLQLQHRCTCSKEAGTTMACKARVVLCHEDVSFALLLHSMVDSRRARRLRFNDEGDGKSYKTLQYVSHV